MRRVIWGIVAVAAVWACGGNTLSGGADGGEDSSSSGGSGGGSGSGGSSSGGGSGSSSGVSSSSGGSGSGSSSGGSSSGSGSGSSSGGVAPVNHRPDDSQCLQAAPPGNCSANGPAGVCTSDAQCVDAGVDGRCINFTSGGPQGCICTTDTCADDAACPASETCACHGAPYTNGGGNHCVQGNCRVDSDCGMGGWCSPTYSSMNCGAIGGYYCHTSKDQCVNDTDCTEAGPFQVCAYDYSVGYWHCMEPVLCAGLLR